MALIEISDLDSNDRDLSTATSSFLTELPLTELESIRGGCFGCPPRNVTLVPIPGTQFALIIDKIGAITGNSTSRTTTADEPNGISSSSDGKNLDLAGNFFYTNNGNAPLGGKPISGFPGAYTF